jgi:hypothetical protein
MGIKKNDLLFILATILAFWFAFTGIFWAYWFALIIAYPAGIASFFIWRNIKKDRKKRNMVIPVILVIGGFVSLGVLAFEVL